MYDILKHKQEISENIQKAFSDTSETIEKAKWQIGEQRTDSRGIVHECYEYTADGKPRLRRVRKNKGIVDTNKNVGKYVNLDSNSSWNEIWDVAKKVSKKWWDEDASKVGVGKDEKEWIKEKMNSICAGFNANVSKKTIIANINTAYQHLDKLSKQTKKEKKEEPEKKNVAKKEPTKLSECVKGDTVAVLYSRTNPQLSGGGYATITKHTIDKVNKLTFEVDGKKFYKDSGFRKDGENALYGSSEYKIVLPSELNKIVKDGKYDGYKINQNDFEGEEKK